MVNFRSWDQLRNNFIIKLTGKPNPYKDNTFEASLVDFVMSIKDVIITDMHKYTELLVQYLVKNQVKANLDPWCLNEYLKKALWLAQFSDVVYITHSENSNTRLQFGIYLEAAMVNMLKEPHFVAELNKLKNLERKNAIHQVLHISNLFYNAFYLPTYQVNHKEKNIVIKNMSEESFQKIDYLPIQTYNFPYSGWVDIETRGYFHHLGDELAFIMAAIYHGDCYILGNDEFGDLQVLNIIQEKWSATKFRVGDKLTYRDMDYIYGLPRTNAMYPSVKNNIFNYSEDLPNSKLNHQENATFTGSYWKNDVFQKYAKRPIEELTMKELIDRIKNTFQEVVGSSNQEIQNVYNNIIQYQKVIKKSFVLKQDFKLRFADEIKLNDLEHLKKIKKANKKLFNFMSVQIKTALMYDLDDVDYDVFSFINDVFVLFSSRSTALLTKPEIEAFLDYGIKQIKSIIPEENIDTLNILNQLNEHLKELTNLFLLQNKTLNDKIHDNLSFFYKTVGHKIHCEIINPKSNKELGFFLKDKKDVRHYLDLNSLVSYLFSQQNLHEISENNDLLSTFIIDNLADTVNNGKSYKTLLKYWYDMDVKAIVLSPVVDMQNEYRMFIINGKVAATSPCFRNSTPFDAWENGRFDARLCHGHSAYETFINRDRVAKYAKFARKFTQEMRAKYPDVDAYVLDVAWNDDLKEVIAIEINTISFSGAYQIDFRRVCSAVAKKPFYYSTVNTQYWSNWKELKNTAQKEIDIENQIKTGNVSVYNNSEINSEIKKEK
jgi:hypothetical protein